MNNLYAEETISVDDRGLAYGDGLFETLAYVNGQLQNWDLHWQRLQIGATRLNIHIPAQDFFLDQIYKCLKHSKVPESLIENGLCVVKVFVTRGVGGRGYLFPEVEDNTIRIRLHPWPVRSLVDYQQGINTVVCQTMLAVQPALAGIKHLNRLEQVLARNEFDSTKFQDGIMLSQSDETDVLKKRVIEGTSSNLFFVIDSKLCTPKIDNCGIQGTIREVILTSEIQVQQGYYHLEQLKEATEVFLTNSVFGVVPVRSITLSDSSFSHPIRWNYAQRTITEQISALINQPIQRPYIF